jgi:hypothetical protein
MQMVEVAGVDQYQLAVRSCHESDLVELVAERNDLLGRAVA